MKTTFVTSLIGAAAIVALAQPYSINWYKVSGGGASFGGLYAVRGTVGQNDAGGPLTGGNYSLTGGFWSFISVIQSEELPPLRISRSESGVIVSWPNTAVCTLQQCNDLAAANWMACPYPVSTVDGTNSITVQSPTGKMFFRLSN